MSKKRMIIALGLIVALLPFLGFPREVRESLSVLAGLAIATIAFLLRRKIEQAATIVKNDTFAQNGVSRGIEGVSPAQNNTSDASTTDKPRV